MYTTCVKQTTAHMQIKMSNDCFPLRSSAFRATRTMQSVRCSLFGHSIQFNTVLVHTVIIRAVLGTSNSPKYSSTSTSTLILKVLEYSIKEQVNKVLGQKYSSTHYKIFSL